MGGRLLTGWTLEGNATVDSWEILRLPKNEGRQKFLAETCKKVSKGGGANLRTAPGGRHW